MADSKSLHDDIAFMRDLADAGATAPLLGGRISILFGGIYCVVSVSQWVLMNYVKPAGPVYLAMWLGAFVISFVAWGFMVRDLRRRPGAHSPANKSAGFAWQACGAGMLVLFACTYILSRQLNTDAVFAAMPPIIFAFYGCAWMVGAMASRQVWMWYPALGSFATALVLATMVASPYLFLYFAAGIFLFCVVPGIIMVRREPRLTV